jgi:hypothetical protein
MPTDAVERVRKLAEYTARHGWASLGIDRSDPPTMTAIIDEAIRLLDARRTAKGKAK